MTVTMMSVVLVVIVANVDGAAGDRDKDGVVPVMTVTVRVGGALVSVASTGVVVGGAGCGVVYCGGEGACFGGHQHHRHHCHCHYRHHRHHCRYHHPQHVTITGGNNSCQWRQCLGVLATISVESTVTVTVIDRAGGDSRIIVAITPTSLSLPPWHHIIVTVTVASPTSLSLSPTPPTCLSRSPQTIVTITTNTTPQTSSVTTACALVSNPAIQRTHRRTSCKRVAGPSSPVSRAID